ncbi:hypothetical protein ACKKBF_B12635 [Auxenochlorella protothecoides x Auxenochlorella symbiontica]|uniref:Chromosome transmission fidelity protein 8-like protein n=2 Tax=Auxenochlorella protothecoides TaxID=3075 RepID=A0A1D2A400_AUXPR
MLVPVSGASGELPAWAMIEMQGEIERKDGGGLDEKFDIGTLSTSSTGSIFLTIGYHQLEGSRVPLKKPFAILEKDTSEGSTGYQVVGVVREKYKFSARPRPLISKPRA